MNAAQRIKERRRQERRTSLSSGGSNGSQCPITHDAAIDLIATQRVIVADVELMKDQVTEMHNRMMRGKGVVMGARIGAVAVVLAFFAVLGMTVAFLSGKISFADLIKGASVFL